MAASFQIDANLLVISGSMICESRELLASLRDGQSTDALLRNSRAMIDESRRLLAALERAASPRRSDNAHRGAIAIASTVAIDQSAGGARAYADCNPALSVRIIVFRLSSLQHH